MLTFPEIDDHLLDSGSFFQRKELESQNVRLLVTVAACEKKAAKRNRLFVWERHGGLRFWRIGRLGGSFYVAKIVKVGIAALLISVSLSACSDELKPQPPKPFHHIAGDPQELVIRGGRWMPQREVTDSGVTILRGR